MINRIASLALVALLFCGGSRSYAGVLPAPVSWNEVPAEALAHVDRRTYDASRIEVAGTTFYLLTRKKNGIEAGRFAKSLAVAWPKWLELFPAKIPTVTFIDYDMFIGGGSFSPIVLGVYFGGAIPEFASKFLKSVADWDPQPTTRAYIEKHYAHFPDPMQAYVDDLVTHELGHIFFGTDGWFALGLGLVYDRIVWNEFSQVESPIFGAVERVWKTKFAKRSDIDQRLINPDVRGDEKAGLIRVQTYSHGKAFAYLSELRGRLGAGRFDELVRAYLARPVDSKVDCEDFLTYLRPEEMDIVRAAETEFTVR
jgi:hypothetical protein